VQNNADIFIYDTARMTRFTFDPSFDRFPIWSPDGSRIVFDSNRKSHRDLYRKRWDDAGDEELLWESAEDKTAEDLSHDGRFLLYGVTNNPKTGFDMWLLPLEGDRKPVVFLSTPFEEFQGQFSPDDRWVAYQSNESGRYEIYVRPFPEKPGGRRRVSTLGGIEPRWRRDGKELYYLAPDGKLMSASITVKGAAIEPSDPVPLFQTRISGGGTNARLNQQYDVAPDGRFLINETTEDAATSPITLLQNWRPPAK
jgi:Tol biopolymer transport system component